MSDQPPVPPHPAGQPPIPPQRGQRPYAGQPPFAGQPPYAGQAPYAPAPAPPYGRPAYAYGSAPAAPAKPAVKVWDVVVTIVLLVLLAGLTLIVSFFGFFLAMASDPCGVRECSTELIGLGMLLAIGLPWVALLVAVVLSIVLLVRRRLAFWVPLAASPLVVGAWFVGAMVASAGVPGS